MTRKEKLFKGYFFIFLCVLSLAMALHNFVCIGEAYISSNSRYISYEYYGGDAYTGIQHAIADTGNNVNSLVATVYSAGRQVLSAVFTTSAFVFVLVFFVCLYIAIKTFTYKNAEETKEADITNTAAKVVEKNNDIEIAEIEKFNNLKVRGLISEEEFELKRKKLLGI